MRLSPLRLAIAALAALPAQAQPTRAPASAGAVVLDPVVISVQRTGQSSFDAPAAISAVTRETIENAGPQVNLSEALNRVPGISVLNRQNYSQDLQLSIRGFGARSTFGIRGVRLIVDGIPATMPDGQGQASNIALSSAGRIEVLRGPLAQLYGNAAGGVVQIVTEADAPVPTTTLSAAAGSHGLRKLGAKFSTRTPGYGLMLDVSQFRTDGARAHSEAERGQLNARWQADLSRDTHIAVVLNALDQPVSLDPLGLTADQFRNGTPGNAAYLAALAQDPRKTVRQQQVGVVLDHRLAEATELNARLYAGGRDLANALSIPRPPSPAQTAPTASGGIVEFERAYGGGAVSVAHRIALGEGRGARLTAGIEIDRMREDRQGYLNNLGVRGALKRDELNRVRTRDLVVQAGVDLSPRWSTTVGLRNSHVEFESRDRYIVAGNPDDSGGRSYSATNPVLGVAYKAGPDLNLYANLGRGFETPTFNELSYRPGGLTGLNTGLEASKSRHAEIGAKWRVGGSQRIDIALFDIATRDEIVVDTNVGGRSTFKNAGRTSRRGIEFSHLAQFGDAWRSTVSATLLRARFDETFVSGTGATAITVPAGNRLPGTPERNLYAELAWAPTRAWGGFNAAIEAVHTGRLYVNDVNSDAAAARTVLNLRSGLRQQIGSWTLSEGVRVDNLADRLYAGSVIVNEGNGRFFEPALERNWLLSVTARYEWR
ncbi:MAG: TonB-dependent receptor [Burkholderiaceae bacterium]